ncbi:MAG: hypothetical protein DMG73_10305 [Acidobacteria bacterium]|nr:MAG: hypothetical protein DMG73_10305 [Acidobacteriota bacterium]
MLLLGAACVGEMVPILKSQTRPPRRSKSALASTHLAGQQVFASNCASCHGLDGRGGERAPDIAGTAKVQKFPDEKLFHIVGDGIPATGMPAFRTLGADKIKAVVSYLRVLQGRTPSVKLPGNPERGKLLGAGGIIGTDLSVYAKTRSVEEIREAITKPGKNVETHGKEKRERPVTVLMRDGQKYIGIARNEDNFSLQLQTLDGAFHFLMKSELDHIEYQPQSLMPSDYGSTLSRQELDDLISFLVSTSKSSKARQSADNGEPDP